MKYSWLCQTAFSSMCEFPATGIVLVKATGELFWTWLKKEEKKENGGADSMHKLAFTFVCSEIDLVFPLAQQQGDVQVQFRARQKYGGGENESDLNWIACPVFLLFCPIWNGSDSSPLFISLPLFPAFHLVPGLESTTLCLPPHLDLILYLERVYSRTQRCSSDWRLATQSLVATWERRTTLGRSIVV